MATTNEKYATKFIPKKTGNFVTNEVVICGNSDTGQIYIRDYNEFALAIKLELGLGNASTREVGNLAGQLPMLGDTISSGEILVSNGGTIVPQISKSAFNKDFGGNGTSNNVARADHSHNELISSNAYIYSEIVSTASGQTGIIIDVNDILAVAPLGSTYISPEISVSVYIMNGTTNEYIDIPSGSLLVTTATNPVTTGTAYNLVEFEIRNLSQSTTYLISVTYRPGRIIALTGGGSRGE